MSINLENTRGTKSKSAKLTADQVRDLRNRATAGESDESLAARFKIDRSQVRRIRLFKAYFDVE